MYTYEQVGNWRKKRKHSGDMENVRCFCKNAMHYIIRNRKGIDKRTEEQWENDADA